MGPPNHQEKGPLHHQLQAPTYQTLVKNEHNFSLLIQLVEEKDVEPEI